MRKREWAEQQYDEKRRLLECVCKDMALAAAVGAIDEIDIMRKRLKDGDGITCGVAREDVPPWVAWCCESAGMKLRSRSARAGDGR